MQQWGKSKLKSYAKPLHGPTQGQVKSVLLEGWASCCSNTIQKSNVLFINMFKSKAFV